jgi:hypothetical protein
MRVTLGIERAKADDGSAFQPSEVLHQARATGGACLGLGGATGVLRTGALGPDPPRTDPMMRGLALAGPLVLAVGRA